MKIDSTVEPLVREAFAASVAAEPERFTAALGAISERGDAVSSSALELALAVNRVALLSVHSGQVPDDQQLDYLAGGLADDAQDWAPSVTVESARAFLEAVAKGSPATLNAPMANAAATRRPRDSAARNSTVLFKPLMMAYIMAAL